MSFSSVVNESGLQTGFYAGDFTFVDVGFLLFVPWTFDVQILDALSIDEGNAQLFFLSCIN